MRLCFKELIFGHTSINSSEGPSDEIMASSSFPNLRKGFPQILRDSCSFLRVIFLKNPCSFPSSQSLRGIHVRFYNERSSQVSMRNDVSIPSRDSCSFLRPHKWDIAIHNIMSQSLRGIHVRFYIQLSMEDGKSYTRLNPFEGFMFVSTQL